MENLMKVLFIECGTTMRSSVNTGIQRVVRRIVSEACQPNSGLFPSAVPVEYSGERFFVIDKDGGRYVEESLSPAREWPVLHKTTQVLNAFFTIIGFARPWSKLRGRLNSLFFKAHPVSQVHLGPLASNPTEKTLLLLDSTWDNSIWRHIDYFRGTGGRVCAVLYDLIPFTHPDTVEEGTRAAHTRWWLEAHKHLDGVMCISKAVRNQYVEWLGKIDGGRIMPPEKVGYFHLGAEFGNDDPIIKLISRRTSYYLMIGSLEPRKNHGTVLDAFELIWGAGGSPSLVIVGAYGWKSEHLIRRITNHVEYKNRLFLIRDASDRDITTLYRCSGALLIASLAEGYGLPIIEALNNGSDVLCSDIAVFHEVAGDRAVYFDQSSPKSIADVVLKHFENKFSEFGQGGGAKIAVNTWAQSYLQLQAGIVACTLE